MTRDPGAPTPPADAPRVLFAGELSYRKGLDVLLAAWTQVRERVPAAELLVAGPPGDIGPTEHAGVRWVGAVENAEIRSLLRTSRAAVLPSRREAMPMFVLEAMSAGRPVIGTPVGAVADTLADAGLVVPVGDVNALAEALVRLLQPGPAARRMGAAGRAGFEARFAAELGLAALRDVYEATGSARFSPATAGAQVEHA